MDNFRKQYDFEELVLLALQGEIDQSRLERLDSILKSDPKKVRTYVELMSIYTELSISGSVEIPADIQDNNVLVYDELMNQLAEEENKAPSVEIPQEEVPKRELIQKVVYKKAPYKFPTTSVVTAIISVAAVLLVVLYVQFRPSNSIPVATLTDMIGAEWMGETEEIFPGQRLYSREPLVLETGVVKIEMDYGAQAVIEGPAEIELLSESQMNLFSGRLYVRVPKHASGFIVDTPTARIVDLGTEFGINVSLQGTSEVHMMKGQASLIPGSSMQRQKGFNLVAGQARNIKSDGQADDIGIDKTAFVQDINSKSNFIWRGQGHVGVADIAGGGNGFGTGKISHGVYITDGKIAQYNYDISFGGRVEHDSLFFHKVPDSPFIDGVFLPDGGLGDVVISSQGHVFKDCPNTSGVTNRPALNGGDKIFLETTIGIPKEEKQVYPMMIQGKLCGTKEYPALCMVSNAGLTFDLQKINDSLPSRHVTAFKAESAFSSNINPDVAKASVYVLVDGKVRYANKNVSVQPENIHIPIQKGDRFLTLITTDNGQVHCDWVLYGRPRLELEYAAIDTSDISVN